MFPIPIIMLNIPKYIVVRPIVFQNNFKIFDLIIGTGILKLSLLLISLWIGTAQAGILCSKNYQRHIL